MAVSSHDRHEAMHAVIASTAGISGAARLGHSSVRVTADIYSHAIRGRDGEAARRWEEFQRQSAQERPETPRGA